MWRTRSTVPQHFAQCHLYDALGFDKATDVLALYSNRWSKVVVTAADTNAAIRPSVTSSPRCRSRPGVPDLTSLSATTRNTSAVCRTEYQDRRDHSENMPVCRVHDVLGRHRNHLTELQRPALRETACTHPSSMYVGRFGQVLFAL
jgi:hypothetical protein